MYKVKLEELGFLSEQRTPAPPTGVEPLRVRATPSMLNVLIDIISDCNASSEVRESAKIELKKALTIDSSD